MMIRDASPTDSVALLRTMKDCPQGSDLVITLSNEPNFFDRAHIDEETRAFLAEESGQIAGSAACAV